MEQKRRHYRLEADQYEPVLIHIKNETFRAIDLSVSGVKIKVFGKRPEWAMEKIIELRISLPNNKKDFLVIGKVCYVSEDKLGLEFIDSTTENNKRIKDYLLELAKNKGFW